ncbi:MAG: SurA N-terminal domain-containing protein [Firmicutes bacterium]|nr:SurA N-terminal domain-containing protein [Bacillota bacterium]MCM1400788.1 SurA N-terminal domain-containing protein [Bacteroides sp.]MCM1476711.1 SurA N-terminal domain-containing protein [Bacteroides sp.]
MATLEKIRSKSVLLLIIIGAALLAFIIGDFFNSSRTLFGSGTTVAKVDGTSIDFQQFQNQMEAASQQAQAQGQKVDQAVLQQQVLNQMIAQTLFDEEIEALGLTVTNQELTDAMLGAHSQGFNAMIMQMSQGQLSAQQFHDMVMNPQKYQLQPEQSAQYRQMWLQYEKEMEQRLLQNKFGNLFNGTLVANKLDAKALYDESANTQKVVYALKPFSAIADNDPKVAVTDEEIQAEWNKTKKQYEINEEVRDVNYITVNIQPSAADVTKGETRVNDLISALNSKPGTEGLEGFDEFVSSRSTVPASRINDRKLRQFVDSAAVGSAKIINRVGNNFNIAKLLSRDSQVDSVNIDVVQVTGNKAQVDSVIMALNGGTSLEDVQKKFAANIAGMQDSAWVSLVDPSLVTMKDALATKATGTFFMPDTTYNYDQPQGTSLVRINNRRAAVPVVEIAAIDYTIDPSNATINELQYKLQDYINKNTTAADFAANAIKNGLQVFPAQVTTSTPQVAGVADTRAAVRWALKAKKGEVSPVFGDENTGVFIAVALNDIYKDYLPATDPQVKKMLTNKLMNDKKAAALIAQYNGKAKDVAGYAQAMNVKADTAAVNFAQFSMNSYPDYVGPQVAGKLYGAKKGAMFGPTQASNGVVVMQVVDVEPNGRPYNFEESSAAFARTRGADALGQMLPAVLMGNKKVKNNLLDFYRD